MTGSAGTSQALRPSRTHADPPAGPAGLINLSTADSLRLLADHVVGRVVYTDGALPAVTPVNYAYDRSSDAGHVLIRTAHGSRIATKLPGNIVAFEVDEVDRTARQGWSVVVTGPCRLVTDESRLAHVNTLKLEPWAPGERDVVLEIAATIVSGYRIARNDTEGSGVG
jgi:uncharacterized protein